ncbi:MAG: hypothetical protein WAQ98_33750 [Blastocatellia bacterium]
MRQIIKIKLMLVIVIINLIATNINDGNNSLINTVYAQGKGRNKNVAKSTAVVAQPFTLEIDDTATRRGVMITVAVDAFTIIRCPKPPVQVIVGNEQAVILQETLPTQTDVYIAGRIAGVASNLILEFEDGQSIIHFQTISVLGGPRPGTYTQEVVLKPTAFKRELKDSTSQIETLTSEVDKLKAQLAEKEQQLSDKEQQQTVAINKDNKLSTLKLLEQATYLGKLNTVEANLGTSHKGHIKISQASRVLRMGENNTIAVLFAIDNAGKDNHFLEFVRANSSNTQVISTLDGARRLPVGTSYVAVLIEDTSNSLTPTKEVVFVINGASVTVKIS